MPLNPQQAKPIGCIAFFIIGVLILAMVKCISNISNSDDITKPTSTTSIKTTPLKIDVKEPNLFYEIINKDTDRTGEINLMYVYIKNGRKIDSLNKYIVSQYQSNDVPGFQIYYFNNRKTAKIYYRMLFDNNVSDAEIDRLSTHIIGHYDYNLTDGGTLKTGKEAQEP